MEGAYRRCFYQLCCGNSTGKAPGNINLVSWGEVAYQARHCSFLERVQGEGILLSALLLAAYERLLKGPYNYSKVAVFKGCCSRSLTVSTGGGSAETMSC